MMENYYSNVRILCYKISALLKKLLLMVYETIITIISNVSRKSNNYLYFDLFDLLKSLIVPIDFESNDFENVIKHHPSFNLFNYQYCPTTDHLHILQNI